MSGRTMALIIAPYSVYHGRVFPVLQRVFGGVLGDGAYLDVDGVKLWFGANAFMVEE